MIPSQVFRIILVDDEAGARATLRNLLAQYCPDTIVVGEAEGVESALALIPVEQADLLMLDVEMEDGTGFDLLDRLSNLPFNVVFTTAHDEYSIRAFRYHALDYLLKPVDPDELVVCIQKARYNANLEGLQQQISELLRTNNKKTFDRITLRTSKGLFFVHANEIACVESCGNYSFVHLSSGERLLDARNLKAYEEILPNPDFVRVHQSFIVNIALVDQVVKEPNGSVLLCGNLEIPVSRRRKDALKGILPLYD